MGRRCKMTHKVLTILSLIGLLLSVALWGVSYFGLVIENVRGVGGFMSDGSWSSGLAHDETTGFYVFRGRVCCAKSRMSPGSKGSWTTWKLGANARRSWTHSDVRVFRERPTDRWWLPAWRSYRGMFYFSLPLYLPILVFSIPPCGLWALSSGRRRKRKKLGLCVKCGYDLRGSKDRCPECNTPFEWSCSQPKAKPNPTT